MRRLTPLLFLVAVALRAQFHLAAPGISLEMNPQTGYGLVHLRDTAAGRDYISPETKLPLYRILLSRSDGSTTEITASDASHSSAERTENGAAFTFDHPDQKLTIRCAVKIDAASSRLSWKIAIRNRGPFGVRSLFYPQWPAPLRLPAGENRLLFPFLDGQEFVDPGQFLSEGNSKRILYPGQAALQLFSYRDTEFGLAGMTLDGEGWVKHFRVARIRGALDLSFEHNPDERPGTDIDLPYETVLQPFRGGWQNAADIYREWAVKQKWARQKLSERNPPRYLREALPIVTFEIRGDAYSAEWSMYFPPSNRLINADYHPSKIPALMERYGTFFGSPVISQPFAWEHIAPWIAGEYFPPVGGEELWARTAASLRSARNPLFLLLSGLRWGVVMDNAGYDDRDRFLKEVAPHAAAYDAAGKPLEEQPPWASSVQLCIGTPFARKHLLDSFVGCVKRGASLVQHDQNHGGGASVCYNRGHEHPPGYGRWMVDDTERVFREIRSAGKRINPDFAFAVEEPCEYFIPYWDLYMGRPYALFGTGYDPAIRRVAAPLFLYVYHEYLLGYGGSNEIDIAHPYAEAIKVARKFTNGTLLEIDPGKPAFRLDTIPSPTEELQLAHSCSHALRTYANPFLLGGRMLRDPEVRDVKTARVRMWRDNTNRTRVQDLPTVDIPFVLQSTWAVGGKVAYVFANWQTTPQTVTFVPQNYLGTATEQSLTARSESGSRVLQASGPLPAQLHIEVPPLSAMMVEQESK